MDLSPESRAMSTSSVCLLQGVLNIQNHYSATMHYSTPKTPDKGPIHKTDWTCSKVMKPARGGQSGWLVSVREGLESRGGGREEEEGFIFIFLIEFFSTIEQNAVAHTNYTFKLEVNILSCNVNLNLHENILSTVKLGYFLKCGVELFKNDI